MHTTAVVGFSSCYIGPDSSVVGVLFVSTRERAMNSNFCLHIATRGLVAGVAVLACSVVVAPARAEIMTFGNGAPIAQDGYTEAGLTINIVPSDSEIDARRSIRDLPGSDGVGERELLINQEFYPPRESPASFVFSLDSGRIFDLLSLNIEDPGGDWSKFGSIVVSASNGSTLILNSAGFGMHEFGTDFQGIGSFRLQCEEITCQATVDNIKFAVAVPEPKAGAMLLAGFVLLGFKLQRGWLKTKGVNGIAA